jgi:hypothetical protein
MPTDLSTVGLVGQQAFYDRMNTAAQTKQYESTANTQNFALEKAQKLQALGEQAGQKLQSILRGDRQPGVDPEEIADTMVSESDQLRMVGSMFITGGAPEEGSDFLTAASEIDGRASTIERNYEMNAKSRLERIKLGADAVGRYLGTAKSQEEYDLGIQTLRDTGALEPEFIEQLAQQPWSEDWSASLAETSTSTYERERLRDADEREERLQRQAKVRNAQAEARIKLMAARNKETKEYHAARLKAAGGKGGAAGVPKDNEVKSTEAYLMSTVFKGVDTKNRYNQSVVDVATQYIAAEALADSSRPGGPDWNTAVARATERAKAEGYFDTRTLEDNFWTEDKTGPDFKATLPMPTGETEEEIAEQLEAGQYYNTSRGRALWTGSEFKAVERKSKKK